MNYIYVARILHEVISLEAKSLRRDTLLRSDFRSNSKFNK